MAGTSDSKAPNLDQEDAVSISIEKSTITEKLYELADSSNDIPITNPAAVTDVTEDDLLEAMSYGKKLSSEKTRSILIQVLKIHENDPNFPFSSLHLIRRFLDDDVQQNPENFPEIVTAARLEAALITTNSPYAEVRAVVENTDDVNVPCSTIRAWVIGLLFTILFAFINQLFSIRQPSIGVGPNVAQLLSFPIGKLLEKTLPDAGFIAFGVRHSLNPGPWSKKEAMLVYIMGAVGFATPYTDNIIWTQYLPTYFNQSYAGQFSYQILIAFGTNFIGYSLAGICRRFLVYPTHCVWPASLTTIALNSAFFSEKNPRVPGPLSRFFSMSRMRFFMITFSAMFVYFWLPDYLFTALSTFNWISWIAPTSINLNAMAGMNNGLGINPFPTFDWNIVTTISDPLQVPFLTTINLFVGMAVAVPVITSLWYTNTYSTGYLPINSNHVYDNLGKRYNVSKAVDNHGLFSSVKYEAYSPPFLTAGNLTVYLFFFGIYTATISYAFLYHRHEIKLGFISLWNSLRRNKSNNKTKGERLYEDIHNKLMSKYPEVPEWWFFGTLLFSVACAVAGIAGWQTYTTPAVVFYGIVLCLIFVIPVGLVASVTGVEVTLNVLAEFIGGSWVAGNGLAMNFFKAFGYVTCAHAIRFSSDLKLAHYVKIPPRHTFWAQMIATFVSSIVCTAVLNFQMNKIENVCEPDQVNHFTCPGINTFFTATVLWGTVGPIKVFGQNGLYTALLVGFPLGLLLPIAIYSAQKMFPERTWLRQIHPVVLFAGPLNWAPYGLSHIWPSVPVAYFSMVFLKKRYLAFWAKYNYVLSASFSSAIALAGVIIFFAVQWNEVNVDWWGNTVSTDGCEGKPCPRLKLTRHGDYFGPRIGKFH